MSASRPLCNAGDRLDGCAIQHNGTASGLEVQSSRSSAAGRQWARGPPEAMVTVDNCKALDSLQIPTRYDLEGR